MEIRVAIFLIISTLTLVSCQDNAQTRIPESLRDCYQDPVLLDRDSRLPMTMSMLIDLIRKVEESPSGNNMDIRTIAIALIHKFRLDGIIRSSTVTSSTHTLPYSPTGFQFSKHRLLLSRLIPGNALLFPNASISNIEKCSLHHMLSSSVAVESRGDEGLVCNRLAQYRTQRLQRDVNVRGHPISDDVEVLDEGKGYFGRRRGNLQNIPPNADDDGFEIVPSVYERQNAVVLSQCPVEDGILYTQWGAVNAGSLIAGIAAGLEPQAVPLGNLVQTNLTLIIDNKFAATLAGDLAEAALRQGPAGDLEVISIGAAGGWNNTMAPRWYFLSQATNYEMTDAEIRGGLDGLILGSYIEQFRRLSSTLRLSQLLDMYYSQKGVFTEQFRACNRKSMLTDVAPTASLTEQSVAFTNYLDVEMQHSATIIDEGLRDFAVKAVTSFNTYFVQNLNDLSCTATANSAVTTSTMRGASDLFIVLESSWNYNEIYPVISYLLDNLDVNRFGTNVTLLNARDGSILANSSYFLSNFHENYTVLRHQAAPIGFDLPQVLITLRNISSQRMEHQRAAGWSGGRSSVVLFLLNAATINDGDMTFSIEQTRIFNEQVPDLYFLYAAAGNRDRFSLLVRDTADDIFTISISTSSENIGTQINPIVERIKRIPLRVINPWCGSDWIPTSSGTRQADYYAEPGKVMYFRLLANYFYTSSGSRVVRIQGGGQGTLNVCYSRTPIFNRLNDTQADATCHDVLQNNVEIRLENYCEGHDYIFMCPSLFISVTAPASTSTSTSTCNENACRFPDNLRFTITTVDLGCFSSSSSIVASFALVMLALLMCITQRC